MPMVLEATYHQGQLILNHPLGTEQEGKKFKVILHEADLEVHPAQFFQWVETHSFSLPDDYRFQRDELYER